MKFLIADDDRVFLELCAGRLRKGGHQVFTASDATQAFMLAVRELPDAIVLDINMPAGGGEDMLRKLKSSSKTDVIPVIVASGLTDPALGERVKGLGAVDFVAKPVPFDELSAALSRALGIALDGGPAVRPTEAVLRFLDACREVQSQATNLCGDAELQPHIRELLRELRLTLLSAGRILLHPNARVPRENRT